MTEYYVRSGGALGSAPWNGTVYTSIQALHTAVGTLANGDIVWVAHDHSATAAGAISWTGWPGVSGAPALVICVNTSTGALATTAIEAASTANSSIALMSTGGGSVFFYGLEFVAGNGNSANIIDCGANADGFLCTLNCKFTLGTHGAQSWKVGAATSSTNTSRYVLHINPTVTTNQTGQEPISLGSVSQGYIYNLSFVENAGTVANLFTTVSTYNFGQWTVVGGDWSTTSATSILETLPASGILTFADAKVGASIAELLTVPTTGANAYIEFYNVHNADRRNQMYLCSRGGIVETETTKVLTGSGADPESNAYSLLMQPHAVVSIANPLRSPPLTIWNDTVGSSVTVTVKVAHDDATALRDNELWLDVEYNGVTGFSQKSFSRPFLGPATLPAGDPSSALSDTSATWGGSWTSKKTYSLTSTFTPQEKGYITVRVCVAKDEDVYVDPVVTLS